MKILICFGLLISSLASCTKPNAEPQPDYLGNYRTTVSVSYSVNDGPFNTPSIEAGTMVVSRGSKPNTVILSNDQGGAEITLVGDSFTIPTETYSNNGYSGTVTGSGKFTRTGFQINSTETEINPLFKTIYKREMIGTKL